MDESFQSFNPSNSNVSEKWQQRAFTNVGAALRNHKKGHFMSILCEQTIHIIGQVFKSYICRKKRRYHKIYHLLQLQLAFYGLKPNELSDRAET